MIIPDIKSVIEQFDYVGEAVRIKDCNKGHINGTYFVECKVEGNEKDRKQKYVLQSINTSIFKRPDHVMSNIVNVTGHIKKKLIAEGKDPAVGTLNIVLTKDGHPFYVDAAGRFWRSYIFVEGDCYQYGDSPALMEKVGKAFGHFQMQLSDFDASVLYESIPNFHNTVSRFADFEKAVKADVMGRAEGVKNEIGFILDRRDKCSFIVDGISEGIFPLRVTHNDTKLNNIVMDPETGEGKCVMDLDTVMPGSVLADFGDAVRFGASSAEEDEKDEEKVFLRLDMFESFVKGFTEGLEGSLTEAELRALPMGVLVITLEQSIRFLEDYLRGDVYFRTHYQGNNLDRARNQMKLVSDMESKMDEMNKIIEKYI
jgi:Ser/Thr protein kinase RdoA (MazF antagonist)